MSVHYIYWKSNHNLDKILKEGAPSFNNSLGLRNKKNNGENRECENEEGRERELEGGIKIERQGGKNMIDLVYIYSEREKVRG